MADLFSNEQRAARPRPQARQNAPRLHTDTEIYEAVESLGAHLLRSIAGMRRDVKNVLGPELLFEVSCMADSVRAANRTAGPAKVPHLEDLSVRLARLQYLLRVANRAGYLPNSAYANSIPITESIGRQASGLKNHFHAPAPSPAT